MSVLVLERVDTRSLVNYDLPTPSNPLASSMEATFFANRARLVSSFAPAEKPAVSPHPPMAIMSLVLGLKRLRMVSGDSNGWKEGGESELKILVGAKAMIAWSISCVWLVPGRSVVWYLYSQSDGRSCRCFVQESVLVNVHGEPHASDALSGHQAEGKFLQHSEK